TRKPLAARSRRGRGESAASKKSTPAATRRRTAARRRRVTASDRDSDFDELSRVASYRRKSSILARILLSRRPTLGRAGSKNFLARRRPPGAAGSVHIKHRRRRKTRLMQAGDVWRGLDRSARDAVERVRTPERS